MRWIRKKCDCCARPLAEEAKLHDVDVVGGALGHRARFLLAHKAGEVGQGLGDVNLLVADLGAGATADADAGMLVSRHGA